MKSNLILVLLFLTCSSAFSSNTDAEPDSLRKDALNVFMNASDYIKKEIPYVNYVRDLKDAGVYIISTSQQTGSGKVISVIQSRRHMKLSRNGALSI